MTYIVHFWGFCSSCVANGLGYLTPEVIISSFIKSFYYSSNDWVTVGMYFLCLQYLKRNRIFKLIFMCIITDETLLLPWQPFCVLIQCGNFSHV